MPSIFSLKKLQESGPRLLVVWMAGFQSVNRTVFREVARAGVPVHLVVPSRYYSSGHWITHEEPTEQPNGSSYLLTSLTPKGTHPRLQTLPGLEAVAKAFRPSHVLVDADPASMLARQALRLPGKALVWALTGENLMPRPFSEFVRSARAGSLRNIAGVGLTVALRHLVQNRIDRAFTLSRDGTTVLTRLGVRTTQTPLGFDPDLFYPYPEDQRAVARAEIGLTAPTIGYFGRLVPEKGLHLLIEVAERMADLSWQLLLDDFTTYTSPYAEKLKAQISASTIEERVVFFEATHKEMPRYMNAADIVVLPSISTSKWKEQYGRVIQEAMACGRTMVGSTCGAIPEIMGGHGHLFAEADVRALERLLRRLLARGEFQDLAARDYAIAELSIARQAQILLDSLYCHCRF
ncbi:MAG: glycosyltransferase [Pseudomonadota bacterium]